MTTAEHDEQDGVAATIRAALNVDRFLTLGELFAEDVIWGDCANRTQALAHLDQVALASPPLASGTVTETDDRLIVSIVLDAAESPQVHTAVFVANGQIVEIIDAADPDHAAAVTPVRLVERDAGASATIGNLAPVLPVSNVRNAASHYRALGFDVEAYDGPAAYAFAGRDSINLHLAQVDRLNPKNNSSAVYLYVDDADALYASWRSADVDGRLVAPQDTDYGLREGAHIDPDGNLMRFGSPIGS